MFVCSNVRRQQFDLANKEAMDESAEWRLKYDVEAERATNCLSELNKVLTIFICILGIKNLFGVFSCLYGY